MTHSRKRGRAGVVMPASGKPRAGTTSERPVSASPRRGSPCSSGSRPTRTPRPTRSRRVFGEQPRLGVHPGRLRRAGCLREGRPCAADRTGRTPGPVRNQNRRQPPPPGLPRLRTHRRRRLRARRGALPGAIRRPRVSRSTRRKWSSGACAPTARAKRAKPTTRRRQRRDEADHEQRGHPGRQRQRLADAGAPTARSCCRTTTSSRRTRSSTASGCRSAWCTPRAVARSASSR